MTDDKKIKAQEAIKKAAKAPKEETPKVAKVEKAPKEEITKTQADVLMAEIEALKSQLNKGVKLAEDETANYQMFAALHFMKLDFEANKDSEKNKMKQPQLDKLAELTAWAEFLKTKKPLAKRTTTAHFKGYGPLRIIEGYGIPDDIKTLLLPKDKDGKTDEKALSAFNTWFV